MVVVVYFGGKCTLWANFGDYHMGRRECIHQFHGYFFLPRKAYILHPFYGKYLVWHCATCRELQCQLFYNLYYNRILFCIF